MPPAFASTFSITSQTPLRHAVFCSTPIATRPAISGTSGWKGSDPDSFTEGSAIRDRRLGARRGSHVEWRYWLIQFHARFVPDTRRSGASVEYAAERSDLRRFVKGNLLQTIQSLDWKKPASHWKLKVWSGRRDSNSRPPAPKGPESAPTDAVRTQFWHS
jgi:hypothetical protein